MTIAQALTAAAAKHTTPGFVAAASHNGKPLYSGATGALAFGAPAPMAEDSIFSFLAPITAISAVDFHLEEVRGVVHSD